MSLPACSDRFAGTLRAHIQETAAPVSPSPLPGGGQLMPQPLCTRVLPRTEKTGL